MNQLKVALFQADLEWEKTSANLKKTEAFIEKLDFVPDLIVLPEMFNSGFTMNAADVAEDMNGPVSNWLRETSNETQAAICGSFIFEDNGSYYNRFCFAANGNIKTVYDKRHLFRMAEEHKTFSPGMARPQIDYRGWKIMPRVCYDLRFPVWSRSNSFDLQIYVANWPAARIDAWDKLLMARAIENQCYVIGVNRVGTDGNDIPYCGHSVVIDPKGNPLTPAQNENEQWVYAECDMELLQAFRQKFPVHMDSDRFQIDV